MSASDRLGILFELIEDAVADVEIVDGIPIVREVNPAFVEVFGYDRETVVDESLNEFIVPGPFATQATNFDQRTKRGQVNRAVVSRQTATGIRRFRYRGVPYDRDGESYGLAMYTDITDEHRREQHHRVLHQVLRHNLRKQLSPILPEAELIAREGSDEIRPHANRIHEAARELSAVSSAAAEVEQILGSQYIQRTERDLTTVLDDVVGAVADSYPDARIECDLPESLPVMADDRLALALENLLENGIEHTDETSTVEVGARREGPNVIARITDDGPGIPERERAAVFEDAPISQHTHGSGLGLWLAKWIVEGYGGRLGYERENGLTTVSVLLPVANRERLQSSEFPVT